MEILAISHNLLNVRPYLITFLRFFSNFADPRDLLDWVPLRGPSLRLPWQAASYWGSISLTTLLREGNRALPCYLTHHLSTFIQGLAGGLYLMPTLLL